MIDPELAEFYQKLYDRPLTEPNDEQEVKDILSCIRVGYGQFDQEDDEQLRNAGFHVLRSKLAMVTNRSRNILAQITRTISGQLYDDPFRFFYELLQNADDAHYVRCKSEPDNTPAITFTVSPKELIVDLNEDGFSLSDVVSICSTGQSSKILDQNTTGAKGLGFKSVFGIANQVHITSGVWSFCFRHQRNEDGIGMISPIWVPGEQLPGHIRTRFRLLLSFTEADGVETLCSQMRSLHPSVVFALRRIKKLSIRFETAKGADTTVSLRRSINAARSIVTISSQEDATTKDYFYRVLEGQAVDMPREDERTQTTSTFTIGLPVTKSDKGYPLLSETGQYVFAFLPILQMTQLPFLIHADFVLTGSRQAILDNAWNRRLRDGIVSLFTKLARKLVLENNALSYRWPAYIPLQPMIGFWQPLPGSIQRALSRQSIFFSRDGSLHSPHLLRIPSPDFIHRSEPLMSASEQSWYFLSEKYKSSDHRALIELGVSRLSLDEAFKLIADDLQSNDSCLYTRPLDDSWHDTFMNFIKSGLSSANEDYRDRIYDMRIMPVRVNNEQEWHQPGSHIFFPNAVDEGVGPESIQIELPTDVDMTVLHPEAAAEDRRLEVYLALGVQHASSSSICDAIIEAMEMSGNKSADDLLRSLELLFWFSYQPPTPSDAVLKALTSGGGYKATEHLFMRSSSPYHAECLVRLDENPEYGKHFLNKMYQSSKVVTRSRGGMTWEQWLSEVGGVRWYPRLQDPSNRHKLHWILNTVQDRDSTLFLSVIQTYWAQEYRSSCQSYPQIEKTLRKSKVLCQHDGVEKLHKTWFPSRIILDTARKYGVEKTLSILTLPDRTGEHLISEWSALRDLGIRYTLDLSFYREALSLLSATEQPPTIGLSQMSCLYNDMAAKVTLDDRDTIQADFETHSLIWDPTCNVWRTMSECVWESRIPLHCRFVITSTYDKATVCGLFDIHLQITNVTTECLIEELEYLRDSRGCETNAELLAAASKVYDNLARMADTAEQRQIIRSSFKEKNLIYSLRSNAWVKSKSCVWHSTMEISNHVPIAAMYSDLQDFFVEVLDVKTVTPEFMMEQLAKTAKSRTKTAENVKALMLAVSELLDRSSNRSDFRSSMEALDECSYLPCRLAGGTTEFRSRSQTFFIVDSENYAVEFGDQLVMLDFSYEQLNSLHILIQILGLDDHYLARHVNSQTTTGASQQSDVLTTQFRQCAYAFSCCAIAHRSPLFASRNRVLYDALANAIIETSSSMASYLVVMQDGREIRVSTTRSSLIAKHDDEGLLITLPAEQSARKQCMRSQLPGYIAADLLDIIDSRGEKQIYRILNELETGTDDILLGESISEVSWLPKTRRPAPISQPEDAIITPPVVLNMSDLPNGDSNLLNGSRETHVELPADETTIRATAAYPRHSRQPYRALPAEIQHEIDAPDYWKVIEHVHRQASKIGGLHQGNETTESLDDLIARFAALAFDNDILDPANYPRLFGHDSWLSKFRLGAAGELLVFEIFENLLGDQFGLANWECKIRHFVQAHHSYQQVTRRYEPEIADIVFNDQKLDLDTQFTQCFCGESDIFEVYFPEWYKDFETSEQETVEWLFEVKTTLGPCDTEFYMSPNQYDMMRELGTQENSERKQVYCIVRVYNLLSDNIGIRIYMDPWRFRDRELEFGTTDKWKVKPVDLD